MSGNDVIAYIALGSNIGNREANLNQAVEMLNSTVGIQVSKVSKYYDTVPVGYTDQPNFLNAAVEIKTDLTADELLGVCSDIEGKLKRKRMIHWGPRTIDLDIILFGNLVMDDELLTIPHPRMHEREFVLEPLNEIAPEAIHPLYNKNICKLYHEILDK